MLQNEFQTPVESELASSNPRVGDLAAMLRVMTPLNGSLPDPAVGRRQLLADLCRFIGVKVGTLPPSSLGIAGEAPPVAPVQSAGAPAPEDVDANNCALSPRQEETLRYLLAGESEKQVARRMKLSKHTVHMHVKQIYRRFGVSSRAELLARHLKR